MVHLSKINFKKQCKCLYRTVGPKKTFMESKSEQLRINNMSKCFNICISYTVPETFYSQYAYSAFTVRSLCFVRTHRSESTHCGPTVHVEKWNVSVTVLYNKPLRFCEKLRWNNTPGKLIKINS